MSKEKKVQSEALETDELENVAGGSTYTILPVASPLIKQPSALSRFADQKTSVNPNVITVYAQPTTKKI